MKKQHFIIAIIFACLLLNLTTAQNFSVSENHPKYNLLVKNLMNSFTTDNEGLKFSCIYALGELKATAATNDLIHILRSDKNENIRIMAALSLTKIGTERALFMVKRVGKFTDSSKVKQFCNKFYKYKTFKLPEEDRILVASLFN